jgi:hypothetical protein
MGYDLSGNRRSGRNSIVRERTLLNSELDEHGQRFVAN